MAAAGLSLLPAYYIEPLYLALHAFNPPTGFPMRFAYVYVFLAVALAARQYDRETIPAGSNRRSHLAIILMHMAIMILLAITGSLGENYRLIGNIVLFLIWGGLLWYFRYLRLPSYY